MTCWRYTPGLLNAEAARFKGSLRRDRQREGKPRPRFLPGWEIQESPYRNTLVLIVHEQVGIGTVEHREAILSAVVAGADTEVAMIALVNTMDAHDHILGRVLSVHRTTEAAERADAKIQRATRHWHGDTSYLPTRIVAARKRVRAGDYIDVRQESA